MRKKPSFVPGIVFACLSLLLLVILAGANNYLIIHYGIVAAKRIILAGWLAPGGVGAILLTRAAAAAMRLRRIQPKQLDSRFSRAFLTRSNTREQLIEIQVKRPKLAGDVEQCLEQLSAVGRLLDRFDALVKTNGIAAKPIEGAKAALKATEDTLCANFRWVINLSIAADEDGSQLTDRFYDQCRKRIRYALGANRTALDKGGDFLIALADNISQVAKQLDADRHSALVEAWIKTIAEQNQQSTITFTEEQA